MPVAAGVVDACGCGRLPAAGTGLRGTNGTAEDRPDRRAAGLMRGGTDAAWSRMGRAATPQLRARSLR